MVYISLEQKKNNPDLSLKAEWKQEQTSPNAGIDTEFTKVMLRRVFIFCSTKESLKCNYKDLFHHTLLYFKK